MVQSRLLFTDADRDADAMIDVTYLLYFEMCSRSDADAVQGSAICMERVTMQY